ncbi:hypothetical protein Tco_1306918 [Tanacetum coccineum]
MSKNDMITRVSDLSEIDLENIINTYNIPLDLHSRLPDPNLTMDRLPSDAIGIYTQCLCFSGVRIRFSSTIMFTSAMSTDRSLSSSTNNPFISPSHWTTANFLKVLAFLFSSLASYEPSTWASYSASLFELLRVYEYSIPSGSIRISPAPDPWSSSGSKIFFVSVVPLLVGSSPAIVSSRKSANTLPFIALLGTYIMP